MTETRLARSFQRRSGRAVSALLLATGLAFASGAALADEAGITLSGAWVRSVLPSRPAAAYFTLKNDTGRDRKIVSASSSACGMVMLHLSKGDRMAMADSVEVPAHGSVAFTPGGYHLMCVKPGEQVKPGATVQMTLTFDDGGTLTASFPVRNAKGE